MVFDQEEQTSNNHSYTRGTIASTFKQKYLVIENQNIDLTQPNIKKVKSIVKGKKLKSTLKSPRKSMGSMDFSQAYLQSNIDSFEPVEDTRQLHQSNSIQIIENYKGLTRNITNQ